MKDKDFKKFVTVYIANTVILILMVVLIVLASQGIIPDSFRTIGIVVILISTFVYGKTSSKMARKYNYTNKKK